MRGRMTMGRKLQAQRAAIAKEFRIQMRRFFRKLRHGDFDVMLPVLRAQTKLMAKFDTAAKGKP